MRVGEVEIGMIVRNMCVLEEGGFSTIQIPPSTTGIITHVYPNGRACAEFEVGSCQTSLPFNCHPAILELVS